ncbi:MAG: sensor domain-containing diguanylate cyclase [Deltaproteobacteria bacterium]|nr:sensor domain-containing diguanylate cyclase [Deltaproteobacteria bacterium]
MAKQVSAARKTAKRVKVSRIPREEKQMLHEVFESSPIPTFVINRDHRVIYWNRALEAMSGITAREVIGSRDHWKAFYLEPRPTIADLIVDGRHNEILRWYHGKYNRSKLVEDAYEVTDFFTILEGSGRWLRFTASALKDAQGSVTGAVETLEDITDRKLAEEALRESEARYRTLSVTDSLTELYNSRHFYDQLQLEIERAERYGHPLSLLLLDIDNFKQFNDTYGHLEGDEVLIRLGDVIRRCLRKTDSAYRFGGEEFTVILPETAGGAATVLAERIREDFADEDFHPVDSPETVHETVSIGVAQYRPREGLRPFIRRADFNMYGAKEEGKNRVCYHPA